MTARNAVLTHEQNRVLQEVYDRFRRQCVWPTFADIDRHFAMGRRRLDAAKVIASVPQEFVIPNGHLLACGPNLPIKLTAIGTSLCSGSEDDLKLFFHALRWMAVQQRKPPTAAVGSSEVSIGNRALQRGLRIPKAESDRVLRLGYLLSVEQWGWTRLGGPNDDGSWGFALSRDVRRFASVRTIEDYRSTKDQWAKEAASPAADSHKSSSTPATSTKERPGDGYIDCQILEQLKVKDQTSSWDCSKLIQIIEELNRNYLNDNALSAHSMLRALLDHVPTLFQVSDFKQVANNYHWGKTDKAYMKKLLDSKLQADEALHTQISKKTTTLLSINDLPPRRQANRLLSECVSLL